MNDGKLLALASLGSLASLAAALKLSRYPLQWELGKLIGRKLSRWL